MRIAHKLAQDIGLSIDAEHRVLQVRKADRGVLGFGLRALQHTCEVAGIGLAAERADRQTGILAFGAIGLCELVAILTVKVREMNRHADPVIDLLQGAFIALARRPAVARLISPT
ncbi:hypothetical protein D2T33_03055 [Sinirhodobacter populi]|uniref:Uncharacterized protein n=1 Tax=Paenirhodobacter populi TaxID=2306993 RepID=A0A443J199_9RHOB|nr:hypothetical protein [Sinirhodobacter populi]RWR14212.1 hypothetical protein D2T33_03055 [Sinirhodobacter populi]